MSATLELLQQLIRIDSITPHDKGCQLILAERLRQLNFTVESLKFNEVDNLWATQGENGRLLVFVGHTDVVPPGPLEKWTYPPFTPTLADGKLYGRGSADMKSGIAAFITALERYLRQHPHHHGRIGVLITSDEEGPSIDGVKRVAHYLAQRKIHIDYCLVGEATCEDYLGDTIKIGRRGTLSATLTIHGKQGHVAYPSRALNPIHQASSWLAELCGKKWDDGFKAFPPTSFQISNIHAGTGANNIIPGELMITFNFRFSPAFTHLELQQIVESLLQRHQLNYDIEWHLGGEPYFTEAGNLIMQATTAIQSVLNITPTLSTTGGTSDGRFIAPLGAEVIEFGPINHSIHQIDEHVKVDDLERLSTVYETILQRLFS
ncbi:MAG: succinyl-diaminopimelate desuccinylase [Legionellales bacterium]|nr:succinyl-diaminopimelate desuccinylase [Legionellales bacterium]